MPGFNKVMLIGNLTRDPQVKHLPSQTVLAEFGLAMNRKYRTANGEDKEETCFVDCAAYGRQAEVIGQFCRKGKQLFVEGRLKYDSWEDKVGGGKRSKVSVVVENFQFLGSRADELNAEAGGQPTMFDEPRPQRPPRRGNDDAGRANNPDRPAKSTAEQPFGEDEKMFEEADIPF
jgi:single-strand DNA-binding protein